jgi:hypothetical protein
MKLPVTTAPLLPSLAMDVASAWLPEAVPVIAVAHAIVPLLLTLRMNEFWLPAPAPRLCAPNSAAPVKAPVTNAPDDPSETIPVPLAPAPPAAPRGPPRTAHWMPALVVRMMKQS